MKQLSIYWNWNVPATSEESLSLKDQLNSVFTDEESLSRLNYGTREEKGLENDEDVFSICSVVQPLNVEGRLKIGKFTRRPPLDAQPLLQGEILLDKVALQLHRNQVCLSLCLSLCDIHSLSFEVFRSSRFPRISRSISNTTEIFQIFPTEISFNTVRTTSRQRERDVRLFRWQWAIQVILDEQVRPRLSSFKWEKIQQTMKKTKEYRELYQKRLTHHRISRDETEQIKVGLVFSLRRRSKRVEID